MRVVSVPGRTVVIILGDADLTEEQLAALSGDTTLQRSRLSPAWLAILVGVLLVVLGLVVVPLLRLLVGGDGSGVLDNIAIFLVGAGAVLIGAGTGTRHR